MNPPDDYGPKPRPLRMVDPQGIADRQWSNSTELAELEQAARAAAVAERTKPTDREYVANSLDHCRYLDLKGIAKDILGEAKPTTPAELADLMAEWAAANKTKAPQ